MCIRDRYTSMSQTFDLQGMTSTIQADLQQEDELYPYGHDAQDFFEVVAKHVGDYVDLYYSDDDAVTSDKELTLFWDGLHVDEPLSQFPVLSGKLVLVDTLASFIMMVTGIHNQVGNVADYLVHPTRTSAKIRPGATSSDVQGAFQGLNIGLMTSQLTPRLLNDFKHLLLRDDKLEATSKVFDTFQADLRNLSAVIDARNERRRFPCNAFNPKCMVAAVSI
eukprot:TRINITY_DN1567_c0_g1_i11.p1 TRINITY_DN1567_c0_g1~~TRINITY_DN1567_c0_g1_i11.p1  ORF type:complete len:221 (+),score=77.56 TRINITY_DN1567_c0_g1_i11:138-800(+)